MSAKTYSLLQPFSRITGIVTNALAWGMALALWLASKKVANAAETTEATTCAPPAASPTTYPKISRPVNADDFFSRPFNEHFSRRYFGRYG